MKAIILAGGRGKRLRPITDYVPKPLIPINNIPIIEWQIRYLKKFGISEAIICSGYKTEMIENYLKNKKLGIKISFSIENKPLGTGGAIKKMTQSDRTMPEWTWFQDQPLLKRGGVPVPPLWKCTLYISLPKGRYPPVVHL